MKTNLEITTNTTYQITNTLLGIYPENVTTHTYSSVCRYPHCNIIYNSKRLETIHDEVIGHVLNKNVLYLHSGKLHLKKKIKEFSVYWHKSYPMCTD